MARVWVVYDAGDWGAGEILLDGDLVLWHELPKQGPVPGGSHALADRLTAYFAGARDDFTDVELDVSWCSAFQRATLDALRAVGYGETVTYGELAALAGAPGAARAAGTFCAQNRFGIVVPCHRVVAANGLGEYGSLGVGYKRRLLELEGTA